MKKTMLMKVFQGFLLVITLQDILQDVYNPEGHGTIVIKEDKAFIAAFESFQAQMGKVIPRAVLGIQKMSTTNIMAVFVFYFSNRKGLPWNRLCR